MTTRTDRPMSEYESALYEAVRILGGAVLELGANADSLLAKLEEAQRDAVASGSENGAATYELLIQALFEPERIYRPGPSN